MMKPVIKWSGSKRLQVARITSLFPVVSGTYYEPFLGGGSILGSLAPEKAVCGDICESLIDVWLCIRDEPEKLADEYEKRWNLLQKNGYTVFYSIRERFNTTRSPHDFLFLTRTCVNGLIRFNAKGEFNNSLHYSRKGIDPASLRAIILEWSDVVRHAEFRAVNYAELTKSSGPNDFVYLDPPYFNTKGRYYGAIDFGEFVNYLEDLDRRGVRFALSFDGSRGDTSYVVQLPRQLYKHHFLLPAGNSAFRKVQDRVSENVHESLYLNYDPHEHQLQSFQTMKQSTLAHVGVRLSLVG